MTAAHARPPRKGECTQTAEELAAAGLDDVELRAILKPAYGAHASWKALQRMRQRNALPPFVPKAPVVPVGPAELGLVLMLAEATGRTRASIAKEALLRGLREMEREEA